MAQGPGDPKVAAFLAALDQLPAYMGPTFRGCADNATFVRPGQSTVVPGLLPTSRSIEVASESGSLHTLYAIYSSTGRDLSRLSANAAEQEVLFRPGSIFFLDQSREVGSFLVRFVYEVQLINDSVERISDADARAFVSAVEADVLRVDNSGHVAQVSSPAGKFSGDIA